MEDQAVDGDLVGCFEHDDWFPEHFAKSSYSFVPCLQHPVSSALEAEVFMHGSGNSEIYKRSWPYRGSALSLLTTI